MSLANIPSTSFLVLYGNYTNAEKIAVATKVPLAAGNAVWRKFINANPNVITGYDIALIYSNINSVLTFPFETVEGSYNITVRYISPSLTPTTSSVQLNAEPKISWTMNVSTQQQESILYENVSLGTGLQKVIISYNNPIAILSITIRSTDGAQSDITVSALNTFIYPNKKYIINRTLQPDYIIPALNSRFYGDPIPTSDPLSTGKPNPDTCYEPSTITPGEPYLFLYGADNLEKKLQVVNAISTYCGRTQWEKLLLERNPNVVTGTETAVILNDASASLRFLFGVSTGIYNIVLRCIMPSPNTDSGFVRLDDMPDQVFTRGLGPPKTMDRQVNFILFEKLSLDGNNYHEIIFSYREPMAYIDLIINRVDTIAPDIVIPALETINNPEKVHGEQGFVAALGAKVIYTTSPPSNYGNLTSAYPDNLAPDANIMAPLRVDMAPSYTTTMIPETTTMTPYVTTTMMPETTTMTPSYTTTMIPEKTTMTPYVTTTIAPIIAAAQSSSNSSSTSDVDVSGSYTAYTSGNYVIWVFTTNATIKFNKSFEVSVIAVAGGGGGAGGGSSTTGTKSSGGGGGANIMCSFTPSASSTFSITVGAGGVAGKAQSSGTDGGDTIISSGGVNYVMCKGGNAGLYDSFNTNLGLYSVSNVYNVKSGNYAPNTSSQGGRPGYGAGGYTNDKGVLMTITNITGGHSATYLKPFALPFTIPTSTTAATQIRTFYGGGGGGGKNQYGGLAGNGVGGDSSTVAIGQNATLYGAGGGGGGKSTAGGNGKGGIVIVYFINPRLTTTLTPSSVPPVSNMTVWLDASVSSNWSSGKWTNKASGSYGNATIYTDNTTNPIAFVSKAINGLSAIQFKGVNSMTVPSPIGTYNNGFTMFVVFKFTSSTNTTLVNRKSSCTIYNENRNIKSGSDYMTMFSGVDLKTIDPSTPYIFILRNSYNSTTKMFYLSEWLNGTCIYMNELANGTYNDNGSDDKVYIGMTDTKSAYFTGYIGEIIMYKTGLSNDEVDDTYNYLSKKWGVQAYNFKNAKFSQLSGNLSQIDIDNNKMCGVNSSKAVYCKEIRDAGWTQIPGSMTWVSLNNNELYGVDKTITSGGNIYYKPDTSTTNNWSKYTPNVDTNLAQIDANGDVICGVTSGNVVYCKDRIDNRWTMVSNQSLSSVSVSPDGSLYGSDSSGNTYYRPDYMTGSWTKLSGTTPITQISSDGNVLCGVNKNSGGAIYCTDPNSNIKTIPTWNQISGSLSQLSVNGSNIAGVNANGNIYLV